jgi:RNA polymerase sigma-70 factor (ECF subfamily)
MSLAADPTDDELVRRAHQGDRQALMALYQRYVNEIYGYAFGQAGNAQDAEDITAETFLRLVGALGSFRGQSSFRTWLYAIARNQVRDHWRRNGRRLGVEREWPEWELAAPGPVGAGGGRPADPRATALGQAVLAALPPNYCQVLQHRILEERSIAETAAAMGTSVANVKVLQHRALKRAAQIAEQLKDEGQEEWRDDHRTDH